MDGSICAIAQTRFSVPTRLLVWVCTAWARSSMEYGADRCSPRWITVSGAKSASVVVTPQLVVDDRHLVSAGGESQRRLLAEVAVTTENENTHRHISNYRMEPPVRRHGLS